MDGDTDKPLFFWIRPSYRPDCRTVRTGSTGVRTGRTAQEKSELMESYGWDNGQEVTRTPVRARYLWAV